MKPPKGACWGHIILFLLTYSRDLGGKNLRKQFAWAPSIFCISINAPNHFWTSVLKGEEVHDSKICVSTREGPGWERGGGNIDMACPRPQVDVFRFFHTSIPIVPKTCDNFIMKLGLPIVYVNRSSFYRTSSCRAEY